MQESKSRYCGECRRDFEPGQLVWYTWLENRSFCSGCKDNIKIQTWEPRKVPERKV